MNDLRRSNVHLIMVTDLSQTLRSTLELGAVVAVLMTLTALAVSYAGGYFARAQIAEALAVSGTVRQEMVAYRAEHGDWPATQADLPHSELNEDERPGSYVAGLDIGDHGSLTALFDDAAPIEELRGRKLSFRPLSVTGQPGAPVSWVCGAHRYADGLGTRGQDETTIDTHLLPSFCRGY